MGAGKMYLYTKKGKSRNVYSGKIARGFRGGRKKSFIAKLADKKINTLFEKRAKQIAIQQIISSRAYYLCRGLFLGVNPNYLTSKDVHPTVTQMLGVDAGAISQWQFAKVGGYLNTDADTDEEKNSVDAVTSIKDMFIYIKNIKFKIRLINETREPVDVQIYLHRVDYSKLVLSLDQSPDALANPRPQIFDLAPLSDFHNISSETADAWKDQDLNKIRHGIEKIAYKKIRLPIQKMIDDVQNAGSARVNTQTCRTVVLSKTYAGKGYKEKYRVRVSTGPIVTRGQLSLHRYFVSLRGTGDFRWSAVSITRFCRGANIPENVIFDGIANV